MDVLGLWAQSHRMASRLLGVPLGQLRPGHQADLLRLDYAPRTPLHADNLFGHLVFGVQARHVRDVWVAGRHCVVDGVLPDPPDVSDTAAALWARYEGERA